MEPLATAVACAGCGWRAPDDDPYPFRCRETRPGDDIDHVLVRSLDPHRIRYPDGADPNPFVRYRELFHAHALGRAHGVSDEDHVAIVRSLDEAVAAVDGHGFIETPFARSDVLSDALGFTREGGVWVKDETGNVSGSHKARHLMGLMIHLRIVERTGLAPAGSMPDLAIASCGNAALAAAVVARAAGWTLRVFVPPDADEKVLARLHELDARVTTCPRSAGTAGDPTYHRLQEAIAQGAVPFTCQGPDNGLTIEGGETLGWEMVDALDSRGVQLDALVVQVGGGALASGCVEALRDSERLGVEGPAPRIFTVQTEGAWPLRRAYDLVVDEALRRIGHAPDEGLPDEERAERLGHPSAGRAAEEALEYARRHRSAFMWPWEETPRSVAHGILDDETYDWAAVVGGMLRTGGYPLVVTEEALLAANDLALTTGIDVDHTGSSGLAGLAELRRRGDVGSDEHVAVLFTGARR